MFGCSQVPDFYFSEAVQCKLLGFPIWWLITNTAWARSLSLKQGVYVTPHPLAGMIADVRHDRDRLNSTGTEREKQGERVASGVPCVTPLAYIL
jgi:hypothetical protein